MYIMKLIYSLCFCLFLPQSLYLEMIVYKYELKIINMKGIFFHQPYLQMIISYNNIGEQNKVIGKIGMEETQHK